MRRRNYMRKGIASVTTVGLLGAISGSAAAANEVDLTIENNGGGEVHYEIDFAGGYSSLSGTLKGGDFETHEYSSDVKYSSVVVEGKEDPDNEKVVVKYPEAIVKKSGDLASRSGSVVVESRQNSNQYSMEFTENVDGTNKNEWGDGHSGSRCHGSVNESGEDKWNFDGSTERIRGFSQGYGSLEFDFSYD